MQDLARADPGLRARAGPLPHRPAPATRRRARASAAATRGCAFDELIERADAAPDPGARLHAGPAADQGRRHRAPRLRASSTRRSCGAMLAAALAAAENGDGSVIRRMLVDEDWYGRDPDTGAYGPVGDRYFTIERHRAALPQAATSASTSTRATSAGAQFDHFWINCGYVELNYGLWPIEARDVFRGPVPGAQRRRDAARGRHDVRPGDARTAAACGSLRELGNARLLTMVGDGHTAYGGNSALHRRRRRGLPDRPHAARGGHALPPGPAVQRAEPGRRETSGCGCDAGVRTASVRGSPVPACR